MNTLFFRKFTLTTLIMWVMAFIPFLTNAAASASGQHIRVKLIAEDAAFVPGRTHYVGVLLSPEEQWHTYWQNPGDSGEAPTISWTLPDYLTAGDIQWTIPEQIPVAHLVNYGYSEENLLIVPITVAENAPIGQAAVLTADISWLVCKEDCIPGWATLSITQRISEQTSASIHAPKFEQTRKKLPRKSSILAKYEVTEEHLSLSYRAPERGQWQLLPLDPAITDHAAPQQYIEQDAISLSVISRSPYHVENDKQIHFLLTDGVKGFYLYASPLAAPPTSEMSQSSLGVLLLMAFLGGVILNLMPCVLPVLSIKAMSLSQSSDDNSITLKLGYAIGILVSFNLFALIIVALKQGGQAIGWGFHMQEPIVVGILAYLFVFIALILLDVAPSGSKLAGVGNRLVQGKGFSAQFFTGVLAVVVASPCTAPFMATALGVAMVSGPITTFSLFSALALGLAMPLTIIYLLPTCQRWLPKPGAWMNHFRQFLAFPMLATVLWLVWVYASQTNKMGQFMLLAGLLVFALSCWWLSLSGPKTRFFSLILMLLSIAGPLSRMNTVVEPNTLPNDVIPFNETELARLMNDNQVVLVNMTADWCITCKVNEQVAFQSEQFDDIIAQENVHYMVGDWTKKDPHILKYLNRYQRSGVPLYVVYAGVNNEVVLPQVLTTSLVVEAIQQAQQEINNEG